MIVHAIDDTAATFSERHGFVASPLGELLMLMPIEAVRSAMA